MKKISLTILMLLLGSIFVSCGHMFRIKGSGHVISKERSVPKFHSVTLRGWGHVFITQGNQQRLVVTTDDNIMPYLRTDVNNGLLTIELGRLINVRNFRTTRLEMNIEIEDIKGLKVWGSGSIEGLNQIRSDSLNIKDIGSGDISLDVVAKNVTTKISGSGDIYLNLDADSLESKISGSGDMFLKGHVKRHPFKINASGKIRAFDLISEETFAGISASGDAELHVLNRLEAKLSSSGSIRYNGNPEIIYTTYGNGTIRPVR